MAEEEDKFSNWMKLHEVRLPGTRETFMFDDLDVKDFEDFVKQYLDRQPLVDAMKKLQGKKIPSSAWVVPAVKIDYLAASERDLRMRYRRRVVHFQIGATHRALAAESMKTAGENIAAITPPEKK